MPRRAVLATPAIAVASIRTDAAAATAAPAKPAPPPKPLPASLDAASVFALVSPAGGGVVSVDLDRSGRVRSALFFYETRQQADAVLRALDTARPPTPPLAVARVPLSTAIDAPLAAPYKRAGFPGYFCGRLVLAPGRRAAALRATGLADLGDRSIPLFYSDDARGSRGDSGTPVEAFWDPKAADRASDAANKRGGGATQYVHEADLMLLLRQPESLDDVVTLYPLPSKALPGDVAFDPAADPLLVLELECDLRASACAVTKVAEAGR